ncbi:hypothetical protein [Synechococcus sp. PCC 6312]|uniref:hypothetical protein n=1 Tax=Synechococcus sp. (strain ATCC 27167 / PCC 6312) TaxID=195253 RepID=UPI00029EFD39|nr:hypothetical protein [Synechococcus sp. PCC 6312]AFY62660.1 hypothetical protein Syn6312_3644 [Synechococcus sp. PCC 6312]
MTTLEQIQKDIQTLPPEFLVFLADFIQLLKNNIPSPHEFSSPFSAQPITSLWEDASKFIGSLEGGPGNLATDKNTWQDLVNNGIKMDFLLRASTAANSIILG